MARKAELVKSIPPAPGTKRGFSTCLDAHGDRLMYTAGTCVFITSLADLASCQTFREHLHPVTCAKFSSSGLLVASGDESGHVKVWVCNNPEQIVKLQLEAFSGPVKDIAWSEDDQRIVAVGQGSQNYGRVFMADSGNNIGEISGHSKTLLSCSFRPIRPFRIFTSGEDFLVNVFNGPPFRLAKSHQHHTNYVNCVRYARDGQKAISVGSDKKILVLNGDTGDILQELPSEHTGSVVACAWTAADSFATCGLDKTVRLWSLQGPVRTWQVGTELGDQQVGLTYCGGRVVSVSLRGAINVWGEGDTPERVSFSHQGKVSHMAWAQDKLVTIDFLGNISKR